MSENEVSDETLASLSAEGRRVVRGMARGGWASGTPAAPAVRRTIEHLGAGDHLWNSEQVAGEPRAFYPDGRGAESFWASLAVRLDALPRRKPTAKVREATPAEVDPCEIEHPKAGCADVGCTHNCEGWERKHAVPEPEPSAFGKHSGYYVVFDRDYEVARWAPSAQWSDYAQSMPEGYRYEWREGTP